MSLVGSDTSVPIKLLRDTGAQHSFVLESVLPFSGESATGDFILMKGMELGVVPVPRHEVRIDCDLVRGFVPVAVWPELSLKGVSMVLGNDLAGSRVWADVPPLPVVASKPVVPDRLEGGMWRFFRCIHYFETFSASRRFFFFTFFVLFKIFFCIIFCLFYKHFFF